MLEKRKEDSEAVGKYSNMLMAAIIGALILFIAPILIVYITGVEIDDGESVEDALFSPPDDLPTELKDKVQSIFDLVMWVARIVVVLFVILAVILLRVRVPSNLSAGT